MVSARATTLKSQLWGGAARTAMGPEALGHARRNDRCGDHAPSLRCGASAMSHETHDAQDTPVLPWPKASRLSR